MPGLRLANKLQMEVTRRVVVSGCELAFYTGGVVLSDAFALCPYYHLPLDLEKLIACDFTSRSERPPKAALSGATENVTIRRFESKDAVRCCELVEQSQHQLAFRRIFQPEELAHVMGCGFESKHVSYGYVVEQPDGTITDFFSFYSLSSNVLHHGELWERSPITMGYLFYHARTTLTATDIVQLLVDKMEELGFDTCTGLDHAGLREGLLECGWRRGSGTLRFYMFNAVMPIIEAEQVAVVAL